MRVVRYMANAFAVGFRAGLGIEKGDALWHNDRGGKVDWVPTTNAGTVIPPTPPVGW